MRGVRLMLSCKCGAFWWVVLVFVVEGERRGDFDVRERSAEKSNSV